MVTRSADLILKNGRIVTQDDQRSLVEAVAIRAKRFIAIGTEAEVMAYRGTQTQIIDLNQRIAVFLDKRLYP